MIQPPEAMKRSVSIDAISEEILHLKQQRNAVILAHYYQSPEVQAIADFIGDSLALAQAADKCEADVILFCGVHFMAETAKILNPDRKVLLPDLAAGCSLADSAPAEEFRAFIEAHPDHLVVSYINCSAEVKAMSDIICTSSNAVRVVNSLPLDRPILFAPDKHLGAYVQRVIGRPMLIWDGTCEVHASISMDKLKLLMGKHPEAKLIAHPECPARILAEADYVGSTSAMLDFVVHDAGTTFIVATEAGILHNMRTAVPHKTLIPAPTSTDNECACSECPYMKLNTVGKARDALRDLSPEVTLSEQVRLGAERSLRRMLSLG